MPSGLMMMHRPTPEMTFACPRPSIVSVLLGSFCSASMDSTMSVRFASSVLLSGVEISCMMPMVFSSSVSAFSASTLSSLDSSFMRVFTFSMLQV